jgi:hypothetical protein
MSTKTRIPRAADEFDGFINRTATYLLAGTPVNNGTRLGLLPEEVTRWDGISKRWQPVYEKYSDKRNSCTPAVREEVYSIIDETVGFDRDVYLLERIGTSPNATIADLEMFNVRKGPLQKSGRTIPQTPISEMVSVTIQPIGGGSVNLKCYSSTAQRAGILDPADCVQYLYMVGSTPPASAEDDSLKLGSSTKGIFTLQTGPGSSGKNLYIYFRWYNSKHPEIAGPWSSMQTTLIL